MRNFILTKKIFLIGAIFILGLFLYSNSALAQATYKALVPIPGVPDSAGVTKYLSGLYTFLISVVGLVAMGAIIIGGARYLTSVGNPSAIEDAKNTIYSAIYGLLLAITSWVIISTINPDILVLKNPATPWGATGYMGIADDPLANCALPGGNGTALAPCTCADGADVTFTPSTVTGPYVVSTTPGACQTSIPPTLSAIIINFSEPMDAVSVTAAGAVTINPAVTYTPSMSTSSQLRLDLTAALGPTDYTVTVAGAKNTAGVAMASNYVFTFSTQVVFLSGCTKPTSPVMTCKEACSNPTAPALNPPGYHCMIADLRAGKTLSNITSDSIWGKVGETIYFDTLTYTASPKPIVAYEVAFDDGFVSGVFGGTDYKCNIIPNTCSWSTIVPTLLNPSCYPGNYLSNLSNVYTAAGVYKARLKVWDDNCNSAEDELDVTIENL